MAGGTSPAGEDDRDASLVEELLGLLPKFVDRTRRQAEFGARAISHLPCIGSFLSGATQPGPLPPHEAPQPADVLSVLSKDGPEDLSKGEPVGQAESSEPDAAGAEDPAEVNATTDAEPVPDVDSLPIPGYESLAASQVIPRLAALSHDELKAVGAYERTTRHRQTILHRVAQLLAT